MKKLIAALFCMVCIFFIVIFIADNKSTANHADPERLYQNDHTLDFFVYMDTAYVNARKIDWIIELKLNRDKELGVIKRTDITKNFKDFDATKLAVGSAVYTTVEGNDILLVASGNGYVPYYKYVEG